MRYIVRQIEKRVEDALAVHPVIVLSGPRQVGKSTLLENARCLKGWKYITLDDAVIQCERANGRQDNWMEPWRGFNLLQVMKTLAVMRMSYARAMVEAG